MSRNQTMQPVVVAQLPSNIPATKIADGSVSDTEFQYLDQVSSNIQTQLSAKASQAALDGKFVVGSDTVKSTQTTISTAFATFTDVITSNSFTINSTSDLVLIIANGSALDAGGSNRDIQYGYKVDSGTYVQVNNKTLLANRRAEILIIKEITGLSVGSHTVTVGGSKDSGGAANWTWEDDGTDGISNRLQILIVRA